MPAFNTSNGHALRSIEHRFFLRCGLFFWVAKITDLAFIVIISLVQSKKWETYRWPLLRYWYHRKAPLKLTNSFSIHIRLANRGLNRFQSWIKTRDSSRCCSICKRPCNTLSSVRKIRFWRPKREDDRNTLFIPQLVGTASVWCNFCYHENGNIFAYTWVSKGNHPQRWKEILTDLSHLGQK